MKRLFHLPDKPWFWFLLGALFVVGVAATITGLPTLTTPTSYGTNTWIPIVDSGTNAKWSARKMRDYMRYTNSAELEAGISDDTGTGPVVFANFATMQSDEFIFPTLTNPALQGRVYLFTDNNDPYYVTNSTGSNTFVLAESPTIDNPNLNNPALLRNGSDAVGMSLGPSSQFRQHTLSGSEIQFGQQNGGNFSEWVGLSASGMTSSVVGVFNSGLEANGPGTNKFSDVWSDTSVDGDTVTARTSLTAPQASASFLTVYSNIDIPLLSNAPPNAPNGTIYINLVDTNLHFIMNGVDFATGISGGTTNSPVTTTPFQGHVATNQLLAAWELDEWNTTGNRTDSWGGFTLTANAAVNWATNTWGGTNGAGPFSTTAYLYAPDNAGLEFGSSNWTIVFWAVMTNYTAQEVFISKDTSSGQRSFSVSGDSSMLLVADVASSLGSGWTTNALSDGVSVNAYLMTNGTPNFCAVMWDGTNVTVQLNGTNGIPRAFAGPMSDSTSAIVLGNRLESDHPYNNGVLDGVRLFKRLLTPTELTHLRTDTPHF